MKYILAIMVSGSALLSASSAMAQTAMQTQAKLAAACEISAPTITYGDMLNMKINTNYQPEFSLDVKCSKDIIYQINDIQGYGFKPLIGQRTGESISFKYFLNRWDGVSWTYFGTKAEGINHTVAGTGTGGITSHRMRVSLRAIDFLPTPDNYSASTTIVLTY